MTAAVVTASSLPLSSSSLPSLSSADVLNLLSSCDTSSAEARKRRREILASQRSLLPTSPDVVSPHLGGDDPAEVSDASSVEIKRRKISTDDSSLSDDAHPGASRTDGTSTKATAKKKPQMKYDPDIPMTKEEAAVWRREQRRKRNRESAAASRQRQRDRICELEVEVEEWKVKYQCIMDNIRRLEESAGISTPATTEAQPLHSRPATPPPLPQPVSQLVTPRDSPTSATACIVSFTDGVVKLKKEDDIMEEEGSQEEESTKMFSRQAVKITGSSSFGPLVPCDEPSIFVPEPCLSEEIIKLEPIDSSLFPCPEQGEIPVLPDINTDPEFGEFLLDAVDWL